jgi:HlyD family secretion protein
MRVRSALFEIATQEPTSPTRIVIWAISTLFGILLAWALIAKLDIVTVAQGRLVPETYVKIVQPAEAGVVREILVRDGDRVEKGQVLVRMDPTVNNADRGAAERELAMSQLQLRRIEAELSNQPMQRAAEDDALLYSQAQAQYQSRRQSFLDQVAQETSAREKMLNELTASREVLRKLEATLPSYQRSAEAFEKLARENLVGTIQAEEKRREAIEKSQDLETQRASVAALTSGLTQQDQRLAQIKSAYVSDLNQSRMDIVSRITRLQQDTNKLSYQQGLLELRAPQAGMVKDLATTTVGAVVQPGAVILNLVPIDEKLQAEVMIENPDIGFIREGQLVRVKLAAFPFQKYGMVDGVVKTVSADAQQQDQRTADPNAQTLAFKAIISLDKQKLGSIDKSLSLAAGMSVSAEIIQDQRTVFEYLLSPVQRVASEAGRER